MSRRGRRGKEGPANYVAALLSQRSPMRTGGDSSAPGPVSPMRAGWQAGGLDGPTGARYAPPWQRGEGPGRDETWLGDSLTAAARLVPAGMAVMLSLAVVAAVA